MSDDSIKLYGCEFDKAPEEAVCEFCGCTHAEAVENTGDALFVVEDVETVPLYEDDDSDEPTDFDERVTEFVTCSLCTDWDCEPDFDHQIRRAEAGYGE